MKKSTILAMIVAGLIISQGAIGNETNRNFGDGSWQFLSPSEQQMRITKEALRQRYGSNKRGGGKLYNRPLGGGASGPGLSNASNIGNLTVINVEVNAAENSDVNVNATSDQGIDGGNNQNATATASDNTITTNSNNTTTNSNNSGSAE